ncbi:uncharacterized protein LOC144162640 isoform X2 [Haemaphysalis longicornis]
MDSGSSSEHSLTTWELPGENWECARPNSSANLDSPNGWFTSPSLSYQLPCSASEGTTCQIVAHLSAWNRFLWPLSWRLREMPGTAGKLIVSLYEPRERHCSPQLQCQATQHVCWLLKTHCCVTHVEWRGAPFGLVHSLGELLVDAIRASESITSVKLADLSSRLDKDLVSAVLSLPHLLELECGEHTQAIMVMLPTFLQGSTSLTALRLPDAYIDDSILEDFFRAVGQSLSLKELVLSGYVIARAPPMAKAALTECLKNSTSLTSLTVALDDSVRYLPLGCILEGLVESRSVLSVDVTCSKIGHADVQLISQIFEHNSVLQSFRIARDSEFYSEGAFAKVDSDRCLKALVGNRTLEQVALPIEVWNEGQWKELFEALPSKRNLRKVIIGVPDRGFLYEEYPPLVGTLCVSLKGTAAEEKVSFDCPFDNEMLHESCMCKAFSSVTLSATGENREAACGLLDRMPSLGHITTMHLELRGVDDQNPVLFSALTTFLGATRSLKTLTFSIWVDDSLHYWQDTVLRGLAVNTSLRKLGIEVWRVSEDISVLANLLAATINTSKNICRFDMHTGNSRVRERTLQILSTGIADNYNLLSVTLPAMDSWAMAKTLFWFKVLDTTRRNCGLLTAAAHFARGTRRDRYCALALDRMRDHPELVEEVARLEKVDEARAATMVCDGLRRMEGMDDFMRFAGVVKERVSCHPREDGRTQLDALNEDCWSAVRRYLKLYDIGDTTGNAPPY